MAPMSPYRDEDLPARVEALRAERDYLSRAVAVTLAKAATHRTWSAWRFFVGLCVTPIVVALSIAWSLRHR
jgi:hypothetical protein